MQVLVRSAFINFLFCDVLMGTFIETPMRGIGIVGLDTDEIRRTPYHQSIAKNAAEFSLKNVLQQSTKGRVILSLYEKHGTLSNDSRNKIDIIIASHTDINPDIRLSRGTLDTLANSIVELFPHEIKVFTGKD